MPNDLQDEQLKLIADRTHGFSGSDVENLCRKGKEKHDTGLIHFCLISKSLCKKKQTTSYELEF